MVKNGGSGFRLTKRPMPGDRTGSRENESMDRDPGHAPTIPPPLDTEEYYFEGELMVFTAAYHLKRGSCCGSGCRHCHYGDSPARECEAAKTE